MVFSFFHRCTSLSVQTKVAEPLTMLMPRLFLSNHAGLRDMCAGRPESRRTKFMFYVSASFPTLKFAQYYSLSFVVTGPACLCSKHATLTLTISKTIPLSVSALSCQSQKQSHVFGHSRSHYKVHSGAALCPHLHLCSATGSKWRRARRYVCSVCLFYE